MSSRQAPRERLVVVGNGMAGMRAVEELLARAPDRYAITVIGAEKQPNYNRILLSSVLAGEKAVDEIVINSLDWYVENGIRLIAGEPVTAIGPAASRLITRPRPNRARRDCSRCLARGPQGSGGYGGGAARVGL